MVYVEVSFDVSAQGDWNHTLGALHSHHHHQGNFDNATVEKVWADRINNHEVLYQFHIKTGHFPSHKHFTVLAEVRHGHVKVLNVQEGHNTLF